MAEQAEETVVIKVAGKNLIVPKRQLTKDSLKFRLLFDELNLADHEIYDFTPEVVEYFINLLKTKKLFRIEVNMFRELHKLSVVFEVTWLTEKCREWLKNKIESARSNREKIFLFDTRIFLFEECWSILDKCKDETMMDDLVSELAHEDNTALLSYYLSDVSKLKTGQIDLLLKLGGWNTDFFLKIILENLAGQKALNSNIKYLLENMNLALCSEVNEGLFLQVMDRISDLTEISVSDLKCIYQLTTSTMRKISYRKERLRPRKTELIDFYCPIAKLQRRRALGAFSFKRIIRNVAKGKVTSMILIIYGLLDFFRNEALYTTSRTDELRAFVSSLENLCDEKKLKKAPRKCLNMMIAAFKCSSHTNSDIFVTFLKEISRNKKLCTTNETMFLENGELILDSNCLLRYKYVFQHPLSATCRRSDSKCGFILTILTSAILDERDYANTGIHRHDFITPRDMFCYNMRKFKYKGKELSVPDCLKNWIDYTSDWFGEWKEPYGIPNTQDKFCVAYNIAAYVVAKK